jgi:hypothetical protein
MQENRRQKREARAHDQRYAAADHGNGADSGRHGEKAAHDRDLRIGRRRRSARPQRFLTEIEQRIDEGVDDGRDQH